jgi:UDPglucose 6-dehydrogenase
MEKAAQCFISRDIPIMRYCEDEYEASENVDAIILMTEWNQFRSLNLETIKANMREYYFFDLRNIYSKESMKELGFKYFSVGRV